MNDSRKDAAVRPLKIAVAGNPNTGKSTLINALAGSRLHVGNWPGVTVEKKSAGFQHLGRNVLLVDLPGAYSLSPYTQEEMIARDYLIDEKPDAIINVVDATNLERNLYFTLQLLELGIPVVVALNMYDEATAKGFQIDLPAMSAMLGAAVIPTTATRGEGTVQLVESAVAAAGSSSDDTKNVFVHYGKDIDDAVDKLLGSMTTEFPSVTDGYPPRWLALKLIEGDKDILRKTGLASDNGLLDSAVRHLHEAHGEDIESLMADIRYGLAADLVRKVLRKPETRKRELTERIDAIGMNRIWGLPIFFAAMWLVFKLTFDLSAPFTDWIDKSSSGPVKRQLSALLSWIGSPDWIVSLATDGVVAGVGMVLTFVPAIFVMMFFITFLEGSGYMASAAFIMDRAMHAIGLHGRSFIPLLMGFGCNVPAIYATRTLENPRDKAFTALLIPLMSCGARLPVYVVFAGAFFSAHSGGTIIWSLYVLGIALAVLMGLIFSKTLFRGESPPFIMELPPYRMPTGRSLAIHTWEKGKHYLVKAGTYILAVSVLVWFLLHLPWGVVNKQDSYLGRTGQVIAPVLAPLGFGTWEASASLISGVIAKEIVISTMAEVYAVQMENRDDKTPPLTEDIREMGITFLSACGEAAKNIYSTFGIASLTAEDKEETAGLKKVIAKSFTPLSAYAFMVFILIYMPCVVVIAAMKQELGGWKWPGIAVLYQTALAWISAFLVYQGGLLFGLT